MKIYFDNGPWKEGLNIVDYKWFGVLDKDGLWLNLHIESEEYKENNKRKTEEEESKIGWDDINLWNKNDKCIISTCHFNEKGILIGNEFEKFALKDFNQIVLNIDKMGQNITPVELSKLLKNPAFDGRILGMDTVINNRIYIERNKENSFVLLWNGDVLLTSIGDYKEIYSFEVNMLNIEFTHLEVRDADTSEDSLNLLNKYVKDTNGFVLKEDENGFYFKIR